MATQHKDPTTETKDVPEAEAKKSKPGVKETAAKTSEALGTAAEAATSGAQAGAQHVVSLPGQAWGQMARLMEGLFSQAFPPVDIIDRDNELRVYAEIPRAHKEDLSVTVSDTSLTIKGVIRQETVEGDYIRQELRHGPFARTVGLPVEVNPSTGKAKFQDDRLELTLTKSTKGVTLKIE